MRNRNPADAGVVAAAALALMAAVPTAAAEGDPEHGARAFRACSACHSLEPGRHLTGPSLADIWGREAGTVEGFARYSEALRSADVVWDAESLDAWLADPHAFIPGNRMTFPGIEDAQARADLIAYLAAATGAEAGEAPDTGRGQRGGGMMAPPRMADLKAVPARNRVTAIRYCGDTYRVTTAAGETIPFWEFNLRFKTDSSDLGPPEGQPALLPASMMGDRAFVIFAAPEEISPFVRREC